MVKIHDFDGKECPVALPENGQEIIKNKERSPLSPEKIQYRY